MTDMNHTTSADGGQTPEQNTTLWRLRSDLFNEVQAASTRDELAIPVSLAQDSELSFGARGLLVALLDTATTTGDPLVSVARVLNYGICGTDKAKSLLRELSHFGYIVPAAGEVDKSGYVYLLRSPTSYYKIGKTNAPNSRLRTFNVKLPFEVEYAVLINAPDMHALEAELHQRFSSKRANGEWFELDGSDVAYIMSLAVQS